MTTSGTAELMNILERLNHEGGFTTSLITDSQGLAIASVQTGQADPEKQAAVVAQMQKSIQQAGRQLGVRFDREIALHAADGQRLVILSFQAGKHDLILLVASPDGQKTYRRLTRRAITEIRRVWAAWE